MSELLASLNGVSNPFIAGSCSALIKVLGNNADLLVSHDTWGPYEVMLKVAKHFKLHYHRSERGINAKPNSLPSLVLLLATQVLPNQEDLFVSHNTWTVYESMLRVLKHYKLNYHLNKIGILSVVRLFVHVECLTSS